MTTTGPRRWPAWAFLGVGGALVLAAVAADASIPTAVASTAAFLISVVALVAPRGARPYRPVAWWVLTVGSELIAVSRVYVGVTDRPVIADQAFGAPEIRVTILYPVIALGVLLLGGVGPDADLSDILDASVVGLGLFLLFWLFLLHGHLASAGAGAAGYRLRPIGAALVAGALVRFLFVARPRAPALRLAIAAVASQIAGSLALVAASVGYPMSGRITDTGALVTAYTVLVAAALLHPSVTEPVPRRHHGAAAARLSRPRRALFVVLTLLGPLAWVVAVVPGRFNPASVAEFGVPVLASGLIALLLVWRLSLTARVAGRRNTQLTAAVGELESLQAELAYRAAHDPLTGLANRSVLSERLESLTPDRPHALLMLDLDGFKEINDSLGHQTGDQVLVEVGRRLTALVPPAGTLVRLGGDEFAILLTGSDEPAGLAFGTAVCDRLRQPYPSPDGELAISTSIGVTAGPLAARPATLVLREADLALYAAKAAGKDRVVPYRRPGTSHAVGADEG